MAEIKDKLQIGINMKLAGSFYERYRSFALATDLSLTYFDKTRILDHFF